MADQKAIMVDAETHAMWKERAAAEGVTLKAYVERCVEDLEALVRINMVDREKYATEAGINMRHSITPKDHTVRAIYADRGKVDPAKCTNRLRSGSYCRLCGAVHRKSA